MFLLDKPYVSDFLKKTVEEHSIPSLNIGNISGLPSNSPGNPKIENTRLFYTNSENSIGWICENIKDRDLIEKIDMFKDKYKFRELLSELHQDFYFRKVFLQDLDKLDIREIPKPFIIKPNVGFFSMGVFKVDSDADWIKVTAAIKKDTEKFSHLYPGEVIDYGSFIIEEVIHGEEYAIDAYYNSAGEPVILNILKHTFSSDSDVSDRVYQSSREIIESNREDFLNYLKEIGRLSGLKNFPCHIELRKSPTGIIKPIEVNPLRFGGWCTTADFAYYAYGFNPYVYFYKQQEPDWQKILKDKAGKTYSLIVLDNSTGIEDSLIGSFDYKKLLADFENPLELRKLDHREYSVFGFLFTETRDQNLGEIDRILRSDLREYVR